MAKVAADVEALESLQDMIQEGDPPDATKDKSEEKPPEDAAGKPKDEGPDELDEDDPKGITKFFDEEHGFKDVEHFANDREWFRHVAELKRKIGERDEDAQLGKRLRERVAANGTDIETLIAGQSKSPDKASEGQPELRPEWLTLDEEGKLRPSLGAPKDVQQRYAQRMLIMLTQPEKFLGTLLDSRLKALEDRSQETKTKLDQRQEQLELEAACTRHRNTLYVGGDPERGMTPLGERIRAKVGRLATSGTQAVSMLDELVDLASSMQPKPTPNRPVSRRAMRQPGAAEGIKPSDDEIDKILARPGGLAALLEKNMKLEEAAEI